MDQLLDDVCSSVARSLRQALQPFLRDIKRKESSQQRIIGELREEISRLKAARRRRDAFPMSHRPLGSSSAPAGASSDGSTAAAAESAGKAVEDGSSGSTRRRRELRALSESPRKRPRIAEFIPEVVRDGLRVTRSGAVIAPSEGTAAPGPRRSHHSSEDPLTNVVACNNGEGGWWLFVPTREVTAHEPTGQSTGVWLIEKRTTSAGTHYVKSVPDKLNFRAVFRSQITLPSSGRANEWLVSPELAHQLNDWCMNQPVASQKRSAPPRSLGEDP
eukprot:RCo022235